MSSSIWFPNYDLTFNKINSEDKEIVSIFKSICFVEKHLISGDFIKAYENMNFLKVT